MAGIAVSIDLSLVEQELLQKILRSRSFGKDLQPRAQIVLAAADKLTNRQIAKDYGIEVHRVGTWSNRFHEAHELWKSLDTQLRPAMNEKLLRTWLADRPGRGRKATITKEQKALITALACKPPSESGYPNTHWNLRLLTQEVIKRVVGQERQGRHLEVKRNAESVFGGQESSDTFCLYAETLFVVESDRDMV